MSIDPDTFREMFDMSEPPVADDIEEPPIRPELIEPPIRRSEPPRSKQEIDEAAADELLKIAAEEERTRQQALKALREKDTFLITCPNGCRIRVKEQHRGKAGKCPRCQAEFVVPKKTVPKKSGEIDTEA